MNEETSRCQSENTKYSSLLWHEEYSQPQQGEKLQPFILNAFFFIVRRDLIYNPNERQAIIPKNWVIYILCIVFIYSEAHANFSYVYDHYIIPLLAWGSPIIYWFLLEDPGIDGNIDIYVNSVCRVQESRKANARQIIS